ncbi:ion channel protein [Cellulomonas sp. URHE0023]|uniref:ion channel protein n=1 Tax=Cellulomonas sp. URHE0023 TaxID=1380354 RepID=UPI0009DCBEFC|nr:ion channel protein [Cellulomonas sp. URHE0023]
MSEATTEVRVPVRELLRLGVPAVVIGVFSALTLVALSELAALLEHWLWGTLPDRVGVDPDSAPWIIGILTTTGLAVGLIIRFAPGNAGPDPATHGLVSVPLPPRVLPGLAAAMVLTLAGGVSLGPENPIMAINAALVVAVGARLMPRVHVPAWIVLTTAGTLGAMFGTPVAAALMLSEINPGDRRTPLWDRLFAPLVAAIAGALTSARLEDFTFDVELPAYEWGGVRDVGLAVVISLGATALGLVASYAFTPMHRLVHRIGSPVLLLTLGGLALGVLGVVGGPVTLFKGLDQMKELPERAGSTTALGFLALAVIKLLAMLVASTTAFRGGRIFPVVFVGVALGFAIGTAWPAVPMALAVGAATTGILVAATRSGWLSVFIAVAIVSDVTLLPALIAAMLAGWVLVSNRPELVARDEAVSDEPVSDGPVRAAPSDGGAPPNDPPAT